MRALGLDCLLCKIFLWHLKFMPIEYNSCQLQGCYFKNYSLFGGSKMKESTVVGIDPASADYQCALVKYGLKEVRYKTFNITSQGNKSFLDWIKSNKVDIIAIEGTGGYCLPLEKLLHKSNINFYSFPALNISRFRESILGPNKNNKTDAAAVANYAITQLTQNRLETFKHQYLADPILRPLTRMCDEKQKETNREINRLWRVIHSISGHLYVTVKELYSKSPESALNTIWFLRLLCNYPDIHSWKRIKTSTILKKIKIYQSSVVDKIELLKKASKNIDYITTSQIMQLEVTASTAYALKTGLIKIHTQIEQEASKNQECVKLMKHKGIGYLTSSQIVAEIIDIKRFANNHKLASYAGYGKREHKTGTTNTERKRYSCNKRLKSAIFITARSYTIHNPDSHLTGYYKSLRSKGMPNKEALKRVGRALIRRIYNELKELSECEIEKKRCEGNMIINHKQNKSAKQPHTSKLLTNNITIEIMENQKKVLKGLNN